VPTACSASELPRFAPVFLFLVFAVLFGSTGKGAATDPVPDHAVGPPTSPEEVVSLEGQVTDQLGAGHSEVLVSVFRKNSDGSRGDALATTKTDRMGDFVVRTKERIRGAVLVLISKPGYSEQARHVDIGPDDDPPFVPGELLGNQFLHGRVMDFVGEKPIARASITLETSFRRWTAETDEKGEFQIEGWTNTAGTVAVEASGYGREVAPIEPDPARTDDPNEVIPSEPRNARVRLQKKCKESGISIDAGASLVARLKRERVIRLSVADDLGAAIPRVVVEFHDEPRVDFRSVLTDHQGEATIRGVHFDATAPKLRLTHADHVSSESLDHELSIEADPIESTHKLVMQRAGRIAGAVMDAATRQPLNGVRVMTGAEWSDTSPRDWTDDRGEYLIRGVPPGETVVTIHLSGYSPELKSTMVAPGETARVNISLGPSGNLTGKILNNSGDPVTGVLVEATKWRGSGTLGLRAMSDAKGEFRLYDAPADEFEISVLARGAPRLSQTVKAGAEIVQLRLESPANAGNFPLAIPEGAALPELSLTTIDGATLKLPAGDGRVVVLDFWATWCGPCVAEIPNLLNVHRKYSVRKDFLMISISLDDDEKTLRTFVTDRKMAWTHVFGDNARTAAERFGVSGIPAIFVVGPDGMIHAADIPGFQLEKELEKAFQPKSSPSGEDEK